MTVSIRIEDDSLWIRRSMSHPASEIRRNLLSPIMPGISVIVHIYLYKQTLRKWEEEIIEKPYQIALSNKNFNGIGGHPSREDNGDDAERDMILSNATNVRCQ